MGWTIFIAVLIVLFGCSASFLWAWLVTYVLSLGFGFDVTFIRILGIWMLMITCCGCKGDKGDKGEKGDKGDKGNDGFSFNINGGCCDNW